MHRSASDRDTQHQGSTGKHHYQSPVRPDNCSLRGRCGGPDAALFQSMPGILPASTAALSDDGLRSVAMLFNEDSSGRFESPDPPPPRL